MIHTSIYIEEYDWEIDFFFALTHYEYRPIMRALYRLQASDKVCHRVWQKMKEQSIDTGFTFSNPRLRSSVVVIGKASRGAEFLNSFCHELRHLTDDIASEENMKVGGEQAAYLTGDIALQLAHIVCQFTCPHKQHTRNISRF